MRWILVTLAAVSLTSLCSPAAHAHGGSFGHGPYGPQRGPSIPCDCAEVTCLKCSAPGLAKGEGLSKRKTTCDLVEAWGEIAQVKITTVFETEEKQRFLEAHAEIKAAPLLAITAGGVKSGDYALTATRAPSQQARRDYLWERNRSLRDPMLVSRRDAATVHVRVFPIAQKVRTTVTLEGFTLLPVSLLRGGRVYRSDEHCLVVLPLSAETAANADLVDVPGGRALHFMDSRSCKRRFPALLERALVVPCIAALYAASSGRGKEAVGTSTALVALPPGRRAPPILFVGKREDAPMIDGPLPPPMRTPEDPVPPPPPPPPRN